MTAARASRGGFTLAELMVVITVLGVMAAVTGMALATRAPVPTADVTLARITAVRDSAVRSGQQAAVVVDVDSAPYLVTAFPDGRVAADSRLGISQLSGRSNRAAR
ncbi:MAG: prepilin-type N-terminal cleavage/methylation domain-containing protein [Gemmatimonadaceae bacterium]